MNHYQIDPNVQVNAPSSDVLDQYVDLVPFLGVAFGEHCEVTLLDCRTHCIIAIANGHISGRSVGAPPTDLAKKIIETGEWQTSDYLANYRGASEENKNLRSSTYFIKQNEQLLGMLCINVDTSEYQLISELAMKLGGIQSGQDKNAMVLENFRDSVNNLVYKVFHEVYGEQIPDVFSVKERRLIIRLLHERQIFQMKGAVALVAAIFGCSEPTIYRELRDCKRANLQRNSEN